MGLLAIRRRRKHFNISCSGERQACCAVLRVQNSDESMESQTHCIRIIS